MADVSAAEHLRLAREALQRQMLEIQGAIRAIDTVLHQLQAVPAAMTRAAMPLPESGAEVGPSFSGGGTRTHVPTVREAIRQVLDEAARPMKTMQIIEGVRALGVVTQDDTVRSILTKRLKAGDVVRVAHAMYVSRAVFEASMNAETPALTGVSVESAPTREEVTDDGTTHMDLQDPHRQTHDPDGRSGAPVEGHGLVAL